MNIKTAVTTIGISVILLASPLVAAAQTANPTLNPVRTANQAARLANLHTVADTAIANRLTSLGNALTRMNGLVKLSSTQKAQYSGEINADISGLNTLKAKCDADTDLATLRTDYRSIFTAYRIYVEFLPQVHLLIASDTMGVTADKLSDFAVKLQARIQTAGNPANLTGLLTDMQAKIADARTQYANVQSQITSLTPQSYDTNPTGTTATLKNARSEIRTGAADLQSAWSDAKQILAALKVNAPTTSTTVTP